MNKMIKKIVKCLLGFSLLFTTLSLYSCSVGSFSFKIYNSFKSTKSTIDKNDISADNQDAPKEIGDKLVELTGDVITLSHYKLPQVGENLYGFKVNAIYDYEARNAKLVIFEHEKSGAKLVLISNDDDDKSAAFGFNTLTYDNKGIPHVFEHACLGGSEKYSNANLFMEATSKTYNTFMNALTMQNATVYPFSSLSDVQLFELYKFYMDGVLNPNVLRDEKNLEREAYRYVLNDKANDISLSGVVYSEMSGVEGNIDSISYRNSLNTMFNESYMGVNTGGKTSDIPNIKLEDLTSFHEKYYKPSNMIITLYGDIDYEKYLKFSDEEYLNKYDKETIVKDDPNYKEQQGFEMKYYDFPVSEDANTDGETIIYYNVVCDKMTPYESGLFELVLDALNNSDGPIKKRLLERYPDVEFNVSSGLIYPKPFFTISFSNVNKEYAEDLKTIVEESFEEILKDGINEDVLESVLNYIEYAKETSKDSHGFAGSCEIEYLRMFAGNDTKIIGLLEHEKAINELEVAYKRGLVKELMEKYISNNDHSSMSITSPKRGMLEEKSNKLKEDLTKMKEGLTDEEIKELINKNKEYDEWATYEAGHSQIEMLRKATLSDLDEYRAKCYAYEETTEGVHFIRSEIEDIKYNQVSLLFDMSGFNMEEAMKIKLLSALLLELPTENYQGQKLKSAFNRYMVDYSAGINVNRYYEGGYKPYFSFSATSLDKNLDKTFEILNELMHKTKFEDVDILKSIVSSRLNVIKNYASTMPTYLAEDYIDTKTSDSAIYNHYITGINYMNYLKKVNAMSDDELRELLQELEQLYNDIYNSNGLVCQIIGNFTTIKKIKEKVILMAQDYKNTNIISRIDISTESEIKNKTAIVSDGTVQYNYIATPVLKDGIEYTAKYAVLANVIDSEVLYPEFRVKRSAYGSYASLWRLNSYIYTYRDPNLKESYEVFNHLPELMAKVKLTDEELDDFKLNAYAQFSYPLTKFQSSTIAINEVFSKVYEKRPDRYVRYMKEIKEMTKEDVHDLSAILDKMVKDGIYVTVGGKEQIEANADMFDEIIYDFVK